MPILPYLLVLWQVILYLGMQILVLYLNRDEAQVFNPHSVCLSIRS